jgi:putative transposase
MKKVIFFLLRLLYRSIFRDQNQLLAENLILRKEIAILKRQLKDSIKTTRSEKRFFAFLAKVQKSFRQAFGLIRPETALVWFKKHIRGLWRYPHKTAGRKPLLKSTRKLILQLKLENPLMCSGKISGELKKMGLNVCPSLVRKILATYRKEGLIPASKSWSGFLKSHWHSLYACDWFTIDTAFAKRIYVFFMMRLNSRKIVQLGFTENPTKIFVRNQMEDFREKYPHHKVQLIHDNGPELCAVDYRPYRIKDIRTSIRAPNMNAFAERFVRSVRQEALDNFIIISRRQARTIVREYVEYYNHQRPHQGIGNDIPEPGVMGSEGSIRKVPVLGGLWQHYYRDAA